MVRVVRWRLELIKIFFVSQVNHSGTWHLQVSGSKIWNLRPNLEAEWPHGAPNNTYVLSPPLTQFRIDTFFTPETSFRNKTPRCTLFASQQPSDCCGRGGRPTDDQHAALVSRDPDPPDPPRTPPDQHQLRSRLPDCSPRFRRPRGAVWSICDGQFFYFWFFVPRF